MRISTFLTLITWAVCLSLIQVEGTAFPTTVPESVVMAESVAAVSQEIGGTPVEALHFTTKELPENSEEALVAVPTSQEQIKDRDATMAAWVKLDTKYHAKKARAKALALFPAKKPPKTNAKKAKAKKQQGEKDKPKLLKAPNAAAMPPLPKQKRKSRTNIRLPAKPPQSASQSVSPVAAQQSCSGWLAKAAADCTAVSVPAERCTSAAMAQAQVQALTTSQHCVAARVACTTYLGDCSSRGATSPECLQSDTACKMVAKACQKAEPNAALARCLPLQKQQMARCGGVYSKAYSSCWHGYDSASSNDPTAVSPSELQTEIAVRRCGLAYAKSTLLCQHRSSLYQREAGLFPEKSTLLQVKRARACQAIHRKGQSSCSHAWSQTDPLEQTRDAAVRQQLDGTASPVFWPGFVATVLHGKDPAPPTNQKQAQASYGDATALRAMLKMAEEIKRQADVPLPPPHPAG